MLSLRTGDVRIARRRALGLAAALDSAEGDMKHDPMYARMGDGQVRAVLTNIARRELNRLMAMTDTAHLRTYAQSNDRIAELDAERQRVRTHAQIGSPEAVSEQIEIAAAEINIPLPTPLTPQILRPAGSLCEDLLSAEIEVEKGRSVQHVAAGVLPAITTLSFEDVLKPPVLLSDACDLLKKHATPSTRRGYEASVALLLEFVGDVPVDQLDYEAQREFAARVSRLPRHYGKDHGRNRFERIGKTQTRADAIDRADEADLKTIERIDALPFSLAKKQHKLREQLVKRVTDTTILKHHRAIRQLLQLAREKLSAPLTCVALSDQEILEAVRAAQPNDALYFRTVENKRRSAWSSERIAALFTSAIYRGCANSMRRWMKGDLVIRDATYWAPLIMLMMGLRPEEALRLRRNWVIMRDGVICLLVGGSDGTHVKKESSHRIVPVPQVLLDLGFMQWVNANFVADDMLFPDAAARTEKDKLSDVFGKHMRLVLERLGLRDKSEDLYAMRRTFQMRLKKAGVEKGDRQRLLGHSTRVETIDGHYTDLDVRHLKTQIDLIDYGIKIAPDGAGGLPVIQTCVLGGAERWPAEVEFNPEGAAGRITVRDLSGRRVLEIITADGGCMIVQDSLASYATLAEAAKALEDIEAVAVIVPPRDPDARRALESFRTYCSG